MGGRVKKLHALDVIVQNVLHALVGDDVYTDVYTLDREKGNYDTHALKENQDKWFTCPS